MGSTNYGFKEDDKLTGKDDFHAWKMILDLKLEDQDVMDYVQGKIQEPPSTATAAAKTKYKKGEIKAKLMIRESIHKSLVAYISELGTSKEMYDKLILMFKVNNVNQCYKHRDRDKIAEGKKSEKIVKIGKKSAHTKIFIFFQFF